MEENILEAKAEFNKVIDFVTGEALGREIDVVEGELFRMLLRLGRQLLQLFLSGVGTGNVGQTVTTAEGSVMRYRRDAPRRYLSIFGVITIVRAYYLKDGGKGIFPLEARLNLPKRKYSYLLQKWMTLSGVRTTYEAAAQWMEEIFGLDLAHRPIQRVTHDLSAVVDEFNDSLKTPDAREEGPILIETLDRKGIPMCKPNPDQPKTPDKPGKKKMVTATLRLILMNTLLQKRLWIGWSLKVTRSCITRKPIAQSIIISGHLLSYRRHPKCNGQGAASSNKQNPRENPTQGSGCRWREELVESC